MERDQFWSSLPKMDFCEAPNLVCSLGTQAIKTWPRASPFSSQFKTAHACTYSPEISTGKGLPVDYCKWCNKPSTTSNKTKGEVEASGKEPSYHVHGNCSGCKILRGATFPLQSLKRNLITKHLHFFACGVSLFFDPVSPNRSSG